RARRPRPHPTGPRPLLARLIPPRNPRRLRYPGMTQQRRLDLARLDAEAADLDLLVGPPETLQNPVTTPARQVSGAIHPAPRRPKRIGHKPLRRQTSSPRIAARKARARNVKLACNPSSNRLETTIQNVNT